jgi:hypothetical protein
MKDSPQGARRKIKVAADFADERVIGENICHEFARMNTNKTQEK